MCRKSRLKTFMKLARAGELIANKAYGRATKLAEKAGCLSVVKTINGLAKSELVHANLCAKVIDGINGKDTQPAENINTAEKTED